MRKSLVGFSHPVNLFLPLESSSLSIIGCDNLSGQLLLHASATSLSGILDHILNADGSLAFMINLLRHLKSSTTNTPALHLYDRSHIFKGFSPDLQRATLPCLSARPRYPKSHKIP